MDERLVKNGVISEEASELIGDAVHDLLDRGAGTYGPDHRDLDPNHDAEAVREEWKRLEREHGVALDYGTDAIRIAHGHIELDRAKERHPYLNDSKLVTIAYQNFRRKGYHRTRYVTTITLFDKLWSLAKALLS
jgi:hypothetical protein